VGNRTRDERRRPAREMLAAVRICIVYDCLFPYTVGGGERWYRNVAERMAREGHEVTYLTMRQWERGVAPELDEPVRVVGVAPRMALYTASGRRRILPPLVFGLGVLVHLLRHGRRYKVLDTSSFPYFSLLAAALLRPLMGYELVVDWFEVWSSEYWRSYLGPAGRFGELVQRICARVPQRAHCFSELHAARLRDQGLRGPITVLRGLLSGEGEVEEPAQVAPVVLFAGRLIPEKRVSLAVAAIARAADRIEGLRGVVLGEGPEREVLRAAVAEHGADEIVRAEGWADAQMLESEMRGAMCMLLTSSREGYGLVVVEAAMHGTPSVVVAGPDNAATELIEEGVNGTVAPSPTPDDVAAAIVRVHEGGLAMRRSTAGWMRRHRQELSLESSLRKVLAPYDNARA
jgi:glycosyltransferase involved in cell wall biosynthesis